MSIEKNRAALERAVELFNKNDLKGYMEIYDASIKFHGMSPEYTPDYAGVKRYYDDFFAAFSNRRLTIDQWIFQEDAAACRYTVTARHTGQFGPVPATNRDVTVTGMSFFRLRDGKVVERWQGMDTFGLMVQLGVIQLPEPAATR